METSRKNTNTERLEALARTMPKWNDFVVEEFRRDPDFLTQSVQDELNAYAQTGELAYLLSTLRDVASAKGWAWLAKETGLSRPTLYEALNGRSKPRFETVTKILRALGFKMLFVATEDSQPEKRPARNIAKTAKPRKMTNRTFSRATSITKDQL